MHRRDYLKLLSTASLAFPCLGASTVSKGRFRPAICAYSFRNQLKEKTMSYADVIRMAADLGVDGVDLTTYWLADTNDETLFPLRKLAYRSGVAIYSIGIRARMSQPTAELRDGELETVKKWLDVAQRLGASHIRIFGGSVPQGATEDQAVIWAVETLKLCADEASRKGILLGLEDDGGLTTNADRTVEIVTKANSPWVGINLDTGNFPNDAYHQIELCAPYATNVHFKSEVHLNHQSQPADWDRILGILDKAGYRGYLALEYESTDDPLTMVPKLVSKLVSKIRSATGTRDQLF
jgi:L-ribulose-5-phosphate 3-epimerase